MNSQYGRQRIAATRCCWLLTVWTLIFVYALILSNQGMSAYGMSLFLHAYSLIHTYLFTCFKSKFGDDFIVGIMSFFYVFFAAMVAVQICGGNDYFLTFIHSDLSIIFKCALVGQIVVGIIVFFGMSGYMIYRLLDDCLCYHLHKEVSQEEEESTKTETTVMTTQITEPPSIVDPVPLVQVVTISDSCPPSAPAL